MGKSTLDKKCQGAGTSNYQGPPIAGYLNKRPIYDLSEGAVWSKGPLTPVPTNAPVSAPLIVPVRRPRGRPRKDQALKVTD
jgi:hypothetical protein